MKAAIGQFKGEVSDECLCWFSESGILHTIYVGCPEHGLEAVKAYHLEKTGEVIDDITANELMRRDTPEEYG